MHSFGASAPIKDLQKNLDSPPKKSSRRRKNTRKIAIVETGLVTSSGSILQARRPLSRVITKKLRRSPCNPLELWKPQKPPIPLKDLLKFGQSVWLDYIRRDLLTSGELKRLIDEDGLRGMTSNPSIFEKAIAGSTSTHDFLKSLRSRTDLDAKGRYEILAIRDIQDAADILRPVYDSTQDAATDT